MVGILSPFLWNLLIDSVLDIGEGEQSDLIAYADDVTIICWDKNPETALLRLSTLACEVFKKLEELLLDVNASKSCFMFFGKSKDPKLENAGISLNPSRIHKYLGITIDDKLKRHDHIENKCAETNKKTMGIKRYLGLTWGLNSKKMMIFYKAVIIPTLTYACSV